MANFKVSQLPELTSVNDNVEVMVIYNGKNYKTTIGRIREASVDIVDTARLVSNTILQNLPTAETYSDGSLVEAIYKSEKNVLHTVKNPKFLILDIYNDYTDYEALEIATLKSKSYITSYLIPYFVKSKLIGYKEYIFQGDWKLIYDPSIFLTKDEADETYVHYTDSISIEECKNIFI